MFQFEYERTLDIYKPVQYMDNKKNVQPRQGKGAQNYLKWQDL